MNATVGHKEKMKKRWPFVIIGFLIGLLVGFGIGTSVGFRASFVMQRKLSELVDDARTDLNENLSVWNTDEHAPDVHAQAAHSILRELPEDDIWPTPGNTIALLGQPSGCNVNGYQGDVAPRLNLWYKQDKVSLGFSIRGPIESVVHFVKPEMRKGWGFPDDFKTSIPRSEWPYMSGTFRTNAPPPELMRKAQEFEESLQTEGDWYPVVMRHSCDYSPPRTPEHLNGILCKSQIMIVDGLRDDLAVVTFSIKGERQYWCDSWWSLSGGNWKRLPPHEGGRILAGEK